MFSAENDNEFAALVKTILLNEKVSKDAKKKALQTAKQKATTDGTDSKHIELIDKLEDIFGMSGDSTASVNTISKQSLYKGIWLQPMSKKQLESIAKSFSIRFTKSERKEVLFGRLMADPRIQAPTSENSSSSSFPCGIATDEPSDAASNGAMNVEVGGTRHGLIAIAGRERAGEAAEKLSEKSMSGNEDSTSISATTAQSKAEDIVDRMIVTEAGASSTSTVIVGGAAKRYTGPIPSLRAGDWISYYFQVLY